MGRCVKSIPLTDVLADLEENGGDWFTIDYLEEMFFGEWLRISLWAEIDEDFD